MPDSHLSSPPTTHSSVLRYLAAWTLILPLAPLLLWQAHRLRANALRLPPAAGPREGRIRGQGRPLRLLVVGESTVAGVGARHHREGLTGWLAVALARRTGRPIEWQAAGLNGVTAHQAKEALLAWVAPKPADLVVLALGVNDVLALHRPRRWLDDLMALSCAIGQKTGSRRFAVSAVPPVGRFPAIPAPLRWIFGLVAGALDEASREALTGQPKLRYVAFPRQVTGKTALFAADGFHPGAEGYRVWADLLAAALDDWLITAEEADSSSPSPTENPG